MKCGGDRAVDWICCNCSKYKGKGERNKYKNYRGISFLIVVGKIRAGILLDRVRRVTGGLTDDEQGGFRAGRACVGQNFTLKQIGEKAREKNAEHM